MSDIQKKTVAIYIDQSAAESALEKLQSKADGFNKKIEETRQKQTALRQEIEKLEPAAKGVDALRKDYDALAKSVASTTKNLTDNNQAQRNLKEQAQQLADKLEAATIRQQVLTAEIKKNEDAGKSVVALQRSYAAVEKEIDLTNQKLAANATAMQTAKQEADALKASLAADKTQLAALNKEIRAGEAAASSIQKAEKEFANLDQRIESNTQSLELNGAAMRKVQSEMDSNMRPSLAAQANLVKQLDAELQHLSQDAPEYAAKLAAFQRATAQLNDMRDAMNGVQRAQSSWLHEAGTVAFGVLIGNTVQSALGALGSYVSGIVSGNARLSDSLADIQKSTGLSADAVANLNSKLSKLDTRTPTEQLRQIAIGLGQINEAASPENVAAIDKIVVALGDEFGGDANQITNVLSVLRNNLQDIKTGNYGDDVAHIGNALNVLGAEGLATAPVVTDISNRIAGVGETFGLTSGQILGTAATFQELGIETERGSSAFIKILQNMAAEPENFAKIAKAAGVETKQDFIDLLNKDMLGAFTKVAEGARLAGKDNTTFGKILKKLDADGSGAGEVLSKLSQNEELLSAKVKLATGALTNQNSITDEFNKKNTTFGAELDKLSKRLGSFISNSAVTSFFTGIVKSLNSMIAPAKSAADAFKEQDDTVKNLERNITPLVTRVDELQKKANELGGTTRLSKDEQVELNKAIVIIGNTIPGAITQFDQYGNAIAISTDKAREFIKIQKNALQVKNAEQIRSTNITIGQLQKEIDYNNKWADDVLNNYKKTIGKEMFGHKVVDSPDNPIYGVAKDIRDKNQSIIAELERQKDYLKTLTGDDLPSAGDAKKTEETKTTPAITFDDDKAEKKGEELLQKLKDFQFELQQIGKEADESEAARITKKYSELTTEAAAYNVHLIGLEKDKNAAIAFLIDEQVRKRKEASDKQFKETSSKEYDQSLADSAAYFEAQKKQQAESFVAGEIDQKQYEANLAAIDVAGKQQQLHNAEDYSAAVEKAAADVTKFKKEELAKEVADLIAANEKKLANEKLLRTLQSDAAIARAQNKVNTSLPGSKEYLAAQKNLLDAQKQQELAAIDDREKAAQQAGIKYTTEFDDLRAALNDKYRQEEAQKDIEYYSSTISAGLDYLSSALNVLNQFAQAKNNNDQRDLDKELKANDTRKAALQKQLNQRLISQQSYNQQVAKLDADADTRKEALAKKQFERNKRMQIAQALIDIPKAILTDIRNYGAPIPPNFLSIAAVGFDTILGAAQVAAIASQKYAAGGRVDHPGNGKITTPSNIPVQPNGDDVLATVKSGEVILNEEQQRRAGGPAFFRRIGVPGFSMGGVVKPQYQTRSYQAIDYAGATRSFQTIRHYASGGVVTGNSNNTTPATDPALLQLLQSNQEAIEHLTYNVSMLQGTLSKPIKAVSNISLKKIDDAYAQKDRILKEATFR